MTTHKISPIALGLSLGTLWGASVLFMGLIAHFFIYGTPFVSAMGIVYLGYSTSITGSIIGGIIGFFDAFIGGVLVAWLYNKFSSCCEEKRTTKSRQHGSK